jgi:hypothetical protein
VLELWSTKGYPSPSLGCLEFPPSHSSYHPIAMIKNSLLVHHSTARPLDPERGTSCIQSSDGVLGPAHTSIRENEQENVSQISWTIPSAFSWPAQVMLVARATIYVLHKRNNTNTWTHPSLAPRLREDSSTDGTEASEIDGRWSGNVDSDVGLDEPSSTCRDSIRHTDVSRALALFGAVSTYVLAGLW